MRNFLSLLLILLLTYPAFGRSGLGHGGRHGHGGHWGHGHGGRGGRPHVPGDNSLATGHLSYAHHSEHLLIEQNPTQAHNWLQCYDAYHLLYPGFYYYAPGMLVPFVDGPQPYVRSAGGYIVYNNDYTEWHAKHIRRCSDHTNHTRQRRAGRQLNV